MFREAILRTKRDELASCIASRKRKLSELYFATVSVSDTEPLPQHNSFRAGKSSTNDHFAFLQANDITKCNYFNEATLPPRALPVTEAPQLESFPTDASALSRQSDILRPDGDALSGSIRSLTESNAPEPGLSIGNNGIEGNNRRSTQGSLVDANPEDTSVQISKASQTESRSAVTSSLDAIVDATIDHAALAPVTADSPHQPQGESQGASQDLPARGILPEIRGIDPKRAILVSSEDTRFLSEPSATLSEAELGSPSASTVHLPPKEVQERHLREVAQSDENAMRKYKREDEKHPPSAGLPLMTDPGSSPSSTVGPYSTATPGLNGASPDTSPEDDVLSDVKPDHGERAESNHRNDDPERVAESEHDSLLRSQMEIARLNALGTDPSTPDAQLRLEEAQSRQASDVALDGRAQTSTSAEAGPFSVGESAELTTHTEEVVQDTMDDEDDEVVGVPTPEDEESFGTRFKGHSVTFGKTDVSNMTTWPPQDTGVESDRNVNEEPLSKLLSNRRPNIHIDTDVAVGGHEHPDLGSEKSPVELEEKPMALARLERESVMQTTASPSDLLATTVSMKPTLTTPATQSPPERMTTRVSSGAIRHKSVSEILGESPRPSVAQVGRSVMNDGKLADPVDEASRAEASNFDRDIQFPPALASKVRLWQRKEREKERSKLSTVIFTKSPFSLKTSTSDLSQPNNHRITSASYADKDYLYTLFVAQASSQPRTQPLNTLLASAHKTLTTSNHYVDFHEQQDCRILKRIYQLQFSNRWSLRQIERSTEPLRPTTHWDVLLGQAKWMRTDFREERKWKIAAAKNLADWCAEWVASKPEDRVLLQVKRRPLIGQAQSDPVRNAPATVDGDTTQVEASDVPDFEPTPDLVPSAEVDSLSDGVDDEDRQHQYFNIAPPAAIFSLAPEDLTFGLKKTPATDKILSELPLYEPSRNTPGSELPTSVISPDASWKTPCLPISKFTFGRMISIPQEPPRKRSRYEYEAEDERPTVDTSISLEDSTLESPVARKSRSYDLPAEEKDVALFNPENKHIRDRIHAGHAFRPPSEYSMPSQSFFECRQSSQWTWNEDDELRKLVKEYSYNWSLISSCLSSPSLYFSGAERRTPWECFERWVGLEGLPADMSKTQYFRAYHARLDAAQRTLHAQQQAAQQQQGNNPGQPPVRRRSSQPVRVERRKSNKYLALIDAMRKLAKKRESAVQKQQHAAGIAAQRKANEATQPRAPVHTPQEFSRLKYERECKVQEKAEFYRQQVLAQQRAALAQRAAAQQSNQQHHASNGANQAGRLGMPGAGNVAGPHTGAALPNGGFQPGMPNQPRQHPPLQAIPMSTQPNGHLSGPAPLGIKGMPPAQMQPNMPGQQRAPAPQMGPENLRVLLEANRLQQEQQRFLQQRQQHQQHLPGPAGPSSSPTMGGLNGVPASSPALLAALQAPNGMISPSTNGISSSAPGPSASPRSSHMTQPQPLSNGFVPAINTISNQIKARHPQLSPEQLKKMTTDSLKQYEMSQAAMSAAAGGAANSNGNLPPPMQQQPMMTGVAGAVHNAQAYAQFMRQQQANQQSRGGATGMNGIRPPSRSATPQTQRSGSVQAAQGQSPRPPQAQMAGNG